MKRAKPQSKKDRRWRFGGSFLASLTLAILLNSSVLAAASAPSAQPRFGDDAPAETALNPWRLALLLAADPTPGRWARYHLSTSFALDRRLSFLVGVTACDAAPHPKSCWLDILESSESARPAIWTRLQVALETKTVLRVERLEADGHFREVADLEPAAPPASFEPLSALESAAKPDTLTLPSGTFTVTWSKVQIGATPTYLALAKGQQPLRFVKSLAPYQSTELVESGTDWPSRRAFICRSQGAYAACMDSPPRTLTHTKDQP